MTFLEQHNKIINLLFPDGEAENLVEAHRQFHIDALVDLQKAVMCFRYGNTNVYPHCSTYFNCGMTVIPAPGAQVRALYTIGKTDTGGSVADGTEVGSADEAVAIATVSGTSLLPAAPVTVALYTPTEDGIYTISVSQEVVKYSIYPYNTPQYVWTDVLYTDVNNVAKVVQVCDFLHLNQKASSGFKVINVKGGTAVSIKTSNFNTPRVDGTVNITASLVKGSGDDDSDWCSKVFYDRVEFCHLERYGRIGARCDTGIFAVADALVANLFGFGGFTPKTSYPAPTDVGYSGLQRLPQGFHYPQKSTDLNGRSIRGVYALHRGRLYIAPWIESTEKLVVEWNGFKNNWSDADEVNSDSNFLKAVTEYVGRQHWTFYENDDTRKNDFVRNYALTVRELINECREKNSSHSCSDAGTGPSAAEGVGLNSAPGSGSGGSNNLFYNTETKATAYCASGEAIVSTIPANRFTSQYSVADANSKAQSAAAADAQSRADALCSGGPNEDGYYYSDAVEATASCPAASGDVPGADGDSVTVPNAVGAFRSTISKDIATEASKVDAETRANDSLTCVFWNSAYTASVSCPNGTTGDAQEYPVAAKAFSAASQGEADQLAENEANNQAAKLASENCVGITVTVRNTLQQFTGSIAAFDSNCVMAQISITGYCYANTISRIATPATQSQVQLEVNRQALTVNAVADWNAKCNVYRMQSIGRCRPGVI